MSFTINTENGIVEFEGELVAVGLDYDGEIKPVNELTYVKETSSTKFDRGDAQGNTVFRWYRIIPDLDK